MHWKETNRKHLCLLRHTENRPTDNMFMSRNPYRNHSRQVQIICLCQDTPTGNRPTSTDAYVKTLCGWLCSKHQLTKLRHILKADQQAQITCLCQDTYTENRRTGTQVMFTSRHALRTDQQMQIRLMFMGTFTLAKKIPSKLCFGMECSVYTWLSQDRCKSWLALIQSTAEHGLHATSSGVWYTELWSKNIEDGWRIWSDGNVKLLTEDQSRLQM